MKNLAIFDDYQGVALEVADWSPLRNDVHIRLVQEHISDEKELAQEIADC